jgi:Protein of unknown function (DUF1353)
MLSPGLLKPARNVWLTNKAMQAKIVSLLGDLSMVETKALSRRRFVYGAAGLFALRLSPEAFAQSCRFNTNEPIVRLLDDGRRVRLMERYEFVDPNGRSWPVPSETVVDGASIPQIFWSVIGGPWEGRYRGASIVHDYYCVTRSRKSPEVHAMFRDAMLCAGVGSRRAFLMYEAVKRFGPSWPDPRPRPPQCDVPSDDYDFDLCTVNAEPPAVTKPVIGRNELANFLSDVQDQADPTDIAQLRRELEKMKL